MAADDPKYLDFTKKPDFQQILTNPILDIAARFWEAERYDAFKICYRSMRIIDDLVDERKAAGEPINQAEKKEIAAALTDWFEAFRACKPRDDFQKLLVDIALRFNIPLWPWQRLLSAMLYDLENDGFGSFVVFLRYAEGAAISPASVFMHLCGVNSIDGVYAVPSFDIRQAARPLALFSYLVHVIRDFQKDHLNGLNYFPADMLREYGLNPEVLKEIAGGAQIPDGFRKLVRRYLDFAGYYRRRARHKLDETKPALQPEYQLSLEIIYSLYSLIYERIDPEGGRLTTEELNPAPPQIQDRIYRTVSDFRPVK